ncbi:hypothetical protein ABPG77_004242 [Micractinium sp. CCAP 211/92]
MKHRPLMCPQRRSAAATLLILALLGPAYQAEAQAQAPNTNDWKCRMAAGSTHTGCGLPYNLSNFQGYFSCDPRVKVGRPRKVDELAAMVGQFDRVKANGVGGSWWAEQFCAGTDDRALNVVLTELESTLAL